MSELHRSQYLIRAVDDDEEHLDALRFALVADGYNVQTYASGQEFMDDYDPNTPGCIILDIRMPELSGTDLQELLNEQHCQIPIIFLTGHGDMNLAIHAFRNGAFDFLQKPVKPEELILTIEKAIDKSDKTYKDWMKTSPLTRFNSLTDRQKLVLKDMQSGLSCRAIAEHLGSSERTIQRHRQNVMHKLGLKKIGEVNDFLKQVRREQEREASMHTIVF